MFSTYGDANNTDSTRNRAEWREINKFGYAAELEVLKEIMMRDYLPAKFPELNNFGQMTFKYFHCPFLGSAE